MRISDTGEHELSRRAAAAVRELKAAKNGFRTKLARWLQQDTEPRRVLVVDDDESWCRAIERVLSASNLVECVHSGEDALRRLRSERFDAVVMDLYLPGITGMETLAELRRESMIPLVPVLVVTGAVTGPQAALRIGRRAGANTVLLKPVSGEAVANEVRQLLD